MTDQEIEKLAEDGAKVHSERKFDRTGSPSYTKSQVESIIRIQSKLGYRKGFKAGAKAVRDEMQREIDELKELRFIKGDGK